MSILPPKNYLTKEKLEVIKTRVFKVPQWDELIKGKLIDDADYSFWDNEDHCWVELNTVELNTTDVIADFLFHSRLDVLTLIESHEELERRLDRCNNFAQLWNDEITDLREENKRLREIEWKYKDLCK